MCEIESFFRDLRVSDSRKVLQHQFAYWVCPVLRGIKPAVLFHARGGELTRLWGELAGPLLRWAGLEEARLSETPSQTAVLLYRAPPLAAWLERPDSRRLLRHYGYDPAHSLERKLARLRTRYDLSAYPHEIGLFLGYPACDVEGYVRNAGKNYKYSGHWKVYGDVERSRQVFTRIDHTRQRMAALLNHQVPVMSALTMLESHTETIELQGG